MRMLPGLSMSPYSLAVILIVVAAAVVVGIPALVTFRIGFCSKDETPAVCFREWLKACAPLATLVAACFAALAVAAAWQNLMETQKGSAVRVDEILRHRLIAIEKEAAEFNTIASKSAELTNLSSNLHDPSEGIQAWRGGTDPQRLELVKARKQLNEQFNYLTGHFLDIDAADLAKTRDDYMGKMMELMSKMDVIISGPVSDKLEDVASWRGLFAKLREFYGKEFAAFSNAYINDQIDRINALRADVRKTEDMVLGPPPLPHPSALALRCPPAALPASALDCPRP